ncbi:transporter [Streptomyces sp. NPDC050617]|uniref:transporter n=1 Tax=Streptomyces sp. NPDC050617 TaxID=3154628 RepID=UPI00343A7501
MRGAHWLAWRQQRTLILVATLTLLACSAYVWFRRTEMLAFIDDHHITICKGWNGGCGTQATERLLRDNSDPIRALATLSMVFPALIGAFWGAPLIGRELENGTFRLALTQGVDPLRWFAARFGLAALCAVVSSTVLAALVAWWWSPIANMLDGPYWYDGYIFNATGPAAIACALFGLAAGTAAGLLTRRMLPAMGIALASVAVVRLALTFVRPDWLSPTARVTPGMVPKIPVGSAWSTGQFGYIKPSGAEEGIMNCPYSGAELKQCMAEHGYVARFHKVHPSSDFWPLQWIETAILLGLALALTVLTIRWLRARHV